jgi:cytidylate kinase
MSILTISREIGAGGPYIGRSVANKLGYHYADKNTINKVFQQYGFIPFDKVYESPTSFWDRFDNMRKLTVENLNSVIQALAHHGNIVIVGRGSYAVLSGLVDVFNIRLQAPFASRVTMFMESEGIKDRAEAEYTLEQRGILRSSFVESTYQVAWDAASNFDLVINVDKVPSDMAVDWLCQALTDMDGRDWGDEPTARSLFVEPYMENAVMSALECKDLH